jgi:hypothetical protein
VGPENTAPVGRPTDGGSRVPAVEHTRVNALEHTISGVTADGHTSSPSRAAAAVIESALAITSPRAADSGSGVDSASPRGLTRPAEDDGPVQGERLWLMTPSSEAAQYFYAWGRHGWTSHGAGVLSSGRGPRH